MYKLSYLFDREPHLEAQAAYLFNKNWNKSKNVFSFHLRQGIVFMINDSIERLVPSVYP